jgi:hypothetical protein
MLRAIRKILNNRTGSLYLMEMDDKTPPMSFLGAFGSLIELFLMWIQVRMV